MDNLVLVGFSCSGKTTVGRILARRLRMEFVDTDRMIEKSTHRTIPAIFREDGEDAFRELERDAVRRACEKSAQVVSTGGGAYVDPRNQDVLRDGNMVVHLRVKPATVIARLQASKAGRPRPLLEGEDPLGKVQGLMEARRVAYEQADVLIDVDNRSIYDVAAEIVRRWYDWRRPRRAALRKQMTRAATASAPALS